MRRLAGSGSPLDFRCWGCRTSWIAPVGDEDGWDDRVELTGRKRKTRDQGPAGKRSSRFSFQYRCYSCGHLGWSNHVQLEEKAQAEL